MDIYLLDNKKELANEGSFIKDEAPNWARPMSFNNRSIVTLEESYWNQLYEGRGGYYYNKHWVTKLIPKEI